MTTISLKYIYFKSISLFLYHIPQQETQNSKNIFARIFFIYTCKAVRRKYIRIARVCRVSERPQIHRLFFWLRFFQSWNICIVTKSPRRYIVTFYYRLFCIFLFLFFSILLSLFFFSYTHKYIFFAKHHSLGAVSPFPPSFTLRHLHKFKSSI